MSEGWISVFERMPEERCVNSEMYVKESGLVLATAFRVSGEGAEKITVVAFTRDGEWWVESECGRCVSIIAWMPLPERQLYTRRIGKMRRLLGM